MNALLDEAGPSSAAAVPRLGVGGTPWPWESWLGGDKHKKQQQPSKRERTRRLDLSTLNPSLQTVGLALAERLMPRYLSKAGLACERMQHAGLPISFIGNVLEACFGEQTDQQMREVFHYFDSSGDGFLDEDEFIAISPLLAEDVPGDSLPTLMAAIDADGNGTVTCEEFVVFVRTCNPRDAGARDGWRAMLPAEGEEGEGGDAVMLAVGRRHEKEMAMKGKNRWRAVNQSDLAKQQRQKEGGRPVSELAVKRVDLDNAQTMIDKLRALRMGDAEVAAIIQAGEGPASLHRHLHRHLHHHHSPPFITSTSTSTTTLIASTSASTAFTITSSTCASTLFRRSSSRRRTRRTRASSTSSTRTAREGSTSTSSTRSPRC